VYPALTVLAELGNDADDILWVGGDKGMEADLVTRQNIPFIGVPAAGVHGVGLHRLPGNLLQLARGTSASRKILQKFKPDVLLFTGGFVAVPMALMGIPVNSLLFVPDIEPGLALKTLARFSDCIAITAEESRQYFSDKKRLELTGYPVRSELRIFSRISGRATLGLREDQPVILVFGGSKGARSINQAVMKNLHKLLELTQVVHISGQLDWEEVQSASKELPGEFADRYHAFPYLHEEMGAALASSDLVVSRAGASSLGEYPLFGLPAILVPYPYAWRYQKVNAQYLERHGAARVIEDQQLTMQLLPTVKELISNQGKLSEMRRAMQSMSKPHAAKDIANLLRELADQAPRKGRKTTW
jgi:UDP-N-acetylglucosamine--N-acetylmuramyl-(pentapeptide) pyrophosphoryl-undecaprenol N-acetylglucosamine transferase